MKILSGKLKGQPVAFKPKPSLRPTPDKVRKAMMDSLAAKLPEAKVLDLFSGTGALGIEAYSSGARKVCFVERHKAQCLALKKTLARLGCATVCEVLSGDVFRKIPMLHRRGYAFDVIFADPPYERGLAPQLMELLVQYPIFEDNAILVIETFKKESLPASCGPLTQKLSRLYGDTRVTYYQVAS